MIVTPYSLTTYQSCPRRWRIEQDWMVRKWRAKSLFDNCLRQGILQISAGSDPKLVVEEMRQRFLTVAADPGLEISSGQPYQVAMDWCAMLATILTALSRITLLQVQRTQPLAIAATSAFAYSPSSFIDESGTLHRWVTVDRWDADAMSREFHSWNVYGDMAITDQGMQLHVIEIGQQREGRRASPWAKAYKHPVIAGNIRFQRPDGKGGQRKLAGEQWRAHYLADDPKLTATQWVDLMDSDHVTPSLVHHLTIDPLSEEQVVRGRAQILQVAQAMHTTSQLAPGGLAMSRPACDGLVVCPWQEACYAPGELWPGARPELYEIRPAPRQPTPRQQPSSKAPVDRPVDTVVPPRIPDSAAVPAGATRAERDDSRRPGSRLPPIVW